jgi:hypothetical protein
MEWLFNNIRMRARLPADLQGLLPSGTTSNEALHAEINSWFRQTQRIHQSTLRLKFRVLGIAKLLAHTCAMYRPTARQVVAGAVLARASARSLWGARAWHAWCRELRGGTGVRKPDLPMAAQREDQAERCRAWTAERTTAAPVPRPRKRTAFARERAGNFRKGGVKNTVFRRPARSQ